MFVINFYLRVLFSLLTTASSNRDSSVDISGPKAIVRSAVVVTFICPSNIRNAATQK